MRILPADLTRLGHEAVEKFPPKGTTTYCNFGVAHIAAAYGVKLERGPGAPMLANEMADHFASSKDWRIVGDWEDAWRLACAGGLVVAASKGNPNGHVACLVPSASMADSGTFGRRVPFIANVGPAKHHGVKALSFGFSPKNFPTLYAYEPQPVKVAKPAEIKVMPGETLIVHIGGATVTLKG
jgi:hypothetical protein